MKHVFLLLILPIFMFVSCMDDERHKVIGDQLTVYFFDADDEQFAVELANYWKQNGFITGKKQDLQISQRNGVYIVSMIANQPKEVNSISFEERKLLVELEKDIEATVFNGETTELEVCNAKFERIYEVD